MDKNFYIKYTKIACFICFFSSTYAQTPDTAVLVKGTKVDDKFANTTQVYRGDKASDLSILDQIAGDYGMGDVVKITEAPPPKPPVEVLPTSPIPPVISQIASKKSDIWYDINEKRNAITINSKSIPANYKSGRNLEKTPKSTNSTPEPPNLTNDDSNNRPEPPDLATDVSKGKTAISPIKKRNELARKTSFSAGSTSEKEEKKRRSSDVPQIGGRKNTPSVSLSYSSNASRSNSSSSYRAYEKKSFFSFLFGKKKKKSHMAKKAKSRDKCYRF